MSSGSTRRLPAIISAYDFSRFERIVDVGGGQGILPSDPAALPNWVEPQLCPLVDELLQGSDWHHEIKYDQ